MSEETCGVVVSTLLTLSVTRLWLHWSFLLRIAWTNGL